MTDIKDILQILSGISDEKSFVINLGDKVLRFTVDEISLEEHQLINKTDVVITPVEVNPVLDFKTVENSNTTIVTALWNLGRDNLNDDFKRPYGYYLDKFVELMKTPSNLYIHIAKEDEEFVWKHRSRKNTFVKVMELEELKTWFPFFDKVQNIRNTDSWKQQASWLENSPQANLEYYNPVVMSKMFLLNDASISNPFNTDYFYWIDAGISTTVHPGYFYHDMVFENLSKFTDAAGGFLFLSYPYEGGYEIHGFDRENIAKYSNTDYVKYVCRGGFFGGKRDIIPTINSHYYALLKETLNNNLMGTEESIFTIMCHLFPADTYRFNIAADGLVWPFFEKMKNVDKTISELPPPELSLKTAQVNLYVLGFNSPKQFETVIQSIKSADETMYNRSRKILINNSTDSSLFEEYDKLCQEHLFEEIHKDNLGVCGGRQFVAEHFDESNADFYMFFEDDMLLNTNTVVGEFCKNGFRSYVPNLYDKVVKIMLKEKFDFLKFSFSEFYGDNSVQWSWYNVPQSVRTKNWPTYDKLPSIGTDPNAPKTQFNTIHSIDETPYVKGEIYYSNWPQIVSKTGNKKMFLETKWARPYEQTWMSHMYQILKAGELTAGILLASPINHNRFAFYDSEMRKES